jgi:hypothetical protein
VVVANKQWMLTLMAAWWGTCTLYEAVQDLNLVTDQLCRYRSTHRRLLRLGFHSEFLLPGSFRLSRRSALYTLQQPRMALRLVFIRRPRVCHVHCPHNHHPPQRDTQVPCGRRPRRGMCRDTPIHCEQVQSSMQPNNRDDGSVW